VTTHNSRLTDSTTKERVADALAEVDSGKVARKTSGMSKAASRANAYARSVLSGAADALNGYRTGNPPTKSEVRGLAASAAKGLPARMGERLEKAVLHIAEEMEGGVRPDQYIVEAALDAAGAAPDEFTDPDAADVNRSDESIDDIVARVPRA
jgi:hypothetical protein